MINRTKIKYSLKKILPQFMFNIVLHIWQKKIIGVVSAIDTIRLKKFTKKFTKNLTHSGHSFSLVLSPNNGFVDNHIYLYGTYEPFILDIFAKYLKSGDTFLDIGANIGQHSMFAASIVGENGTIHSFEPIPHIYEQVLESVKKNNFEKTIKVHNFALGDKNCSQELYFENRNLGGSSLVESKGKTGSITVQIKRGDEILKSEKNIAVVKIDVEGYEYQVLEGLRETLTHHSPVIILEFSFDSYKKNERGHETKILALLTTLGYTMYDIEDAMKKIASYAEFLNSFNINRPQTNILCLPNKKSNLL